MANFPIIHPPSNELADFWILLHPALLLPNNTNHEFQYSLQKESCGAPWVKGLVIGCICIAAILGGLAEEKVETHILSSVYVKVKEKGRLSWKLSILFFIVQSTDKQVCSEFKPGEFRYKVEFKLIETLFKSIAPFHKNGPWSLLQLAFVHVFLAGNVGDMVAACRMLFVTVTNKIMYRSCIKVNIKVNIKANRTICQWHVTAFLKTCHADIYLRPLERKACLLILKKFSAEVHVTQYRTTIEPNAKWYNLLFWVLWEYQFSISSNNNINLSHIVK